MDDLLRVDDLTIETFRFGVSRMIPEMTQVAVATRKNENVHERDNAARRKFLYHLSRADYRRDFGSKYRRPGIFARSLAFLMKLIPKFGPLKALDYKDPTPQTEDLYFKSMNEVVDQYHRLLQQVEAGQLAFSNRNLDTGELTRAGQYRLGDEAYGELIRRLAKNHFAHLTPALRANVLEYCASGPTQNVIKGGKRHETEAALRLLREQASPPEPASRRDQGPSETTPERARFPGGSLTTRGEIEWFFGDPWPKNSDELQSGSIQCAGPIAFRYPDGHFCCLR